MNQYKGSALAKSTQSAYRSHLNAFLRFCVFFGCTPIPADRDTICCYTAFLARSLAPSSINGYLNIIRLLHLDAGLPNPLENNWEVQQIKRGIARIKGSPIKQKFPISISILREIFALLDHVNSSLDKAFWSACLIAFFGFFRKSTILPVSVNSPPGICRSDVKNFTLLSFDLVVRHTKTIQFGQRVLVLPFYTCMDQRLCPVRALWSHLMASPVHQSKHIFSYVLNGSMHLLTHEVFVKKLRSLITRTGRNPALYSAHSFRRGGSTFAFSLNMPLLQIKKRGDWKSNCVERYVDVDEKLAMDSAVILSVGAYNS